MKKLFAGLLIGFIAALPFGAGAIIQGLDLTSANTAIVGPLDSAKGGAGTITGALKGNGAGVVTQAALADLSDTTACAPFTPTDQSGASLTFTSVSVQFCKYGNIVYVYGKLSYPVTANGNSATISLPVAVPNQPYAGQACGFTEESGVQDVYICPVVNTSTAQFFLSSSGTNKTNANLSAKVMSFSFFYPAS